MEETPCAYIPLDITLEECLLDLRELYPYLWGFGRPSPGEDMYARAHEWFEKKGYINVKLSKWKIKKLKYKLEHKK